MRAATGLGDRLGALLLQLPPNLRADPGALDACLAEFARFPAGGNSASPVRVAVEFRHESWWTTQTRQLLARRKAALCWADRLGRPVTPLWRTADWGYLRFHEGAAQPWPRYGAQALRSWVERTGEAWPGDADVFVTSTTISTPPRCTTRPPSPLVRRAGARSPPRRGPEANPVRRAVAGD
jgi:uncharacterized protein YecE (DUF72 family)